MTESFRYPGTVLVVGGGRMGEAIVAGLIDGGVIAAERVSIAEPDAPRRESLETTLHVATIDTADTAKRAASADVVLLAVKPQVIDGVVSSLSASLAEALVVTIAAGVSTKHLEALLPQGTAVVRVMPNTPALVREGMAVVSGGSNTTAAQVETIREMFASIGEAIIIDERYQDAAGAISGSGPAYFALIIDSLARAGVRQGLSRDVAQKLAIQTMRGTAKLIEDTAQHPHAVIDAVTSPGGTTIAALEAMQRGRLPTVLAEGVAEAVKRAKELGS